MESSLYIAVDLGAGSGRVFLAGVDPGEFYLEEIHRFQYPPATKDGHLRWDFQRIFNEIKAGLKMAGERARELGRGIKSIGIDSWAVDYGLIDADGKLIADPVCYRDDRTLGSMERVFARVPKSTIFEKTGIQFQNFNTLFQLNSESADLSRTSKMLLLPDLLNFYLTGRSFAEYTNATTTQMVNAATGDWDLDLLEKLDLPLRLLPKIVPAGTTIGELRPEIAAALRLDGVKVTLPATHDTGSAVAGAPLTERTAYISSGTWSLIGVERTAPLINRDVARHNFTNEGGVFGTFRFLKNVMGLWIFESCRREWKARGIELGYDEAVREADKITEFHAFVFPDDPRFLNPRSMLAAIREQLGETGQVVVDEPAAVAKVIFDSLAFRSASVLRSVEDLTGEPLTRIQILGGGGRNRYLSQMTADASRLLATTGLTEATVVGNVLVQAIAAGRFDSLSQARRHVADNFEFEVFVPRPSTGLDDAVARYSAVERRFVSSIE